MAQYTVWFTDSFGNRIKPLRFFQLDYARSLNAIGKLAITVPKSAIEPRYFDVDCRLEVWRTTEKGRHYLDTGAHWLIQQYRETFGARGTYTFDAVSSNHVLTRRIVAYSSGTSQATKNGAISTVMQQLVDENFGSSAATARVISSSYFSVQPEILTTATVSGYEVSRKYVFDCLRDLANISASKGEPIFFDVIGRGATLITRITNAIGTDRRTRGVLFSDEMKNFTDVSITTDYTDEITHAYVLGQGQGGGRLIGEYTDNARVNRSPFNRREATEEGRNATTQSGLNDEAAGVVRGGKPRFIIDGAINNTPHIAYGDEWGFGDLVYAKCGRNTYECYVSAVNVSVSGNKEKITARLRTVTQ